MGMSGTESSPLPTSLFRYLSLVKLIDLVCNKRLPIVKIDCLGDPNEGAIVRGSSLRCDLVALDPNSGLRTPLGEHSLSDDHSLYSAQLGARTLHYASCWYDQSSESVALWKIYAADHGVMIEVPTDYLADVIATRNGVIRRVTYCDIHSPSDLDGNDAFSVSTRKHIAYLYEAEVRLLFQQDFSCGVDPTWTVVRNGKPQVLMPKVQYIPFMPEKIIRITVSPDSAVWQQEALQRVLNLASCKAVISTSRLAGSVGISAPNGQSR